MSGQVYVTVLLLILEKDTCKEKKVIGPGKDKVKVQSLVCILLLSPI